MPTAEPTTAHPAEPTTAHPAEQENIKSILGQLSVCTNAIKLLTLASIAIKGAGTVSCDGATGSMTFLVERLYLRLCTLHHQLDFSGQHPPEKVELIKLCKLLASKLDEETPPLVQKMVDLSVAELTRIKDDIPQWCDQFIRDRRYPQEHMTNFVNNILTPPLSESSNEEEGEGLLRRRPAFQDQ
jgi:hypothetical protein